MRYLSPRMVGLLLAALSCTSASFAQPAPPGTAAPGAAAAPPTGDVADPKTLQSAAFLFRGAMHPQRDGGHNVLVRALRQLADPDLKPFFAALADMSGQEQFTLRIHGFLGLAELDPQKKLDLGRLAAIKDARMQGEILTAAMDNDLLSVEQAKQVAGWQEMEPAVRVMVAMLLVKEKQFNDMALLRKAAQAELPARRGMAALLLLQLGDTAAIEILRGLDKSTDPKRDEIRESVLQTALHFEFEKIGPWALALATEPGVSPRLALVGLRTAMRFHQPGADALWQKQFAATTDPAQRTRFGLVALNLAPWAQPALYAPLLASDDPFLKKLGAAGQAVTTNEGIAKAVAELVKLHHPIANAWALGYASKFGTKEDAATMLTAMIQAYEPGDRDQAQRLDDALSAAYVLHDRDPQAAATLLRPILADPKTDKLLAEVLLLGLARSKGNQAYQVVAGLPPSANPDVNALVLVLAAKAGQALSPQQLKDLALLVRGGADVAEGLRLQAAWLYLKRTGQAEAVLGKALSSL